MQKDLSIKYTSRTLSVTSQHTRISNKPANLRKIKAPKTPQKVAEHHGCFITREIITNRSKSKKTKKKSLKMLEKQQNPLDAFYVRQSLNPKTASLEPRHSDALSRILDHDSKQLAEELILLLFALPLLVRLRQDALKTRV